jgi:hypothetical protein
VKFQIFSQLMKKLMFVSLLELQLKMKKGALMELLKSFSVISLKDAKLIFTLFYASPQLVPL